jgi:hypothetical protein
MFEIPIMKKNAVLPGLHGVLLEPKDEEGNILWEQHPTENIAVFDMRYHNICHKVDTFFSEKDCIQLTANYKDHTFNILSFPEGKMYHPRIVNINYKENQKCWKIDKRDVITSDIGAPIVNQEGRLIGMVGDNQMLIPIKTILEVTNSISNKETRTFVVSLNSQFGSVKLKATSFYGAAIKARLDKGWDPELKVKVNCEETGTVRYFPPGTPNIDHGRSPWGMENIAKLKAAE